MIALVPEELERYAAERCAPESAALRWLARETYARAALPQMQVGRLEGGFLRLLVRLSRARRVLEIGTFTGYSALAMAEGLPPGGRVTTCDVDPVATAIAAAGWSRSPHGRKIRLLLGPATSTLRSLAGPFDLAFIDADKENYWAYWQACLPRLRRGGLVAVDNVLWGGEALRPRGAAGRAIAAFNDRVRRDRRVESVMLTVRDGVTLAWKR